MTHSHTSIYAFLLICLLAVGCGDRSGADAGAGVTTQEIPPGLLSHTEGTIRRDDRIFVQLVEAPSSADAIHFALSPTTEGITSIEGRYAFFAPTNGWEAATRYTATVSGPALGQGYTFAFATPERRYQLFSNGIFIPNPDDPTSIEARGTLITSDDLRPDEAVNIVSASQGDTPLTVTVRAGSDARSFTWVASGAVRTADPTPIIVRTDGTALGYTTTPAATEVRVTPLGEFKLLSAELAAERDNEIQLAFSDPVDTRQDLSGVLAFGNDLRFTTRVSSNRLSIFLSDAADEVTLFVRDGLRSRSGDRLGTMQEFSFTMGAVEPAVRLVGQGSIIPHAGRRLFSFEAQGLSAVRLEIVRIYANNVQDYVRDNPPRGANYRAEEYAVRTVGRIEAQQRVVLSELAGGLPTNRWARYALDLGDYIADDASALYVVRLGFGPEDALTTCDIDLESLGLESLDEARQDYSVGFRSITSMMSDYEGIHGYYDGFKWEDRDNPCMPAYYNAERFASRTVLSTNLGLIAKRNPDKTTLIFATDLIAAGPVGNAEIRIFDASEQLLATGTTDANGRLLITTERPPAFVSATYAEEVTYLEIDQQSARDKSRFATAGSSAVGGVKGSFYAERGVWRPGDTVFLNFVLADRQQRLPENYPVEFSLTDPQGRVAERRGVRPAAGTALYPLTFTTQAGDLTGNWTATVEAAGKTYRKNLAVETVKPNRLAVDLALPAGGLQPGDNQLTLEARWLYGAPGSNLRATVDATLRPRDFNPAGLGDFRFQDDARRLDDPEAIRVFDGQLGATGRATFAITPPPGFSPGPLRAALATQVFEPGGNFSIDNQGADYDPYSTYLGVAIPQDRWGNREISINASSTVRLASVDTRGQPVGNRGVTVGVYRLDWRYWWQDNYDNVARFAGAEHREAIETFSARTGADGRGTVSVSVPRWGRYLLRACDEGGHCSSGYFYAGSPADATSDRESAALLQLRPEQPEVAVGQDVVIQVPSSAGGKLLVSLETGVGSIEQRWVEAGAGTTEVRFVADERMVPTVYADVTLLQPYAQTTNDRPPRLYGTVPLTVTDPKTVLQPEIEVADAWRPRQRASIAVSETDGRAMTYTLAVVDEGLLGLTRFGTPDLTDAFLGKEALTVTTYDLYQRVMSSLDGDYGKVLAIGGGDGEGPGEQQTANRFEPVVRHLGPFRLTRGATDRHVIDLPNYVGAVRVMVVAHDIKAYGSASQTVAVKQPLMVLPNLPRRLAPGETVQMPVNVFAMEEGVRDVELRLSEENGLARPETPTQRMAFERPGSRLAYFPVSVGERTGIANFAVTARGGGQNADQSIEIDVVNPNERIARTNTIVIDPGKTATIDYVPFGQQGTREATVELSTLPSINLGRHLRYLLRYPYGCAEQTISPAFAQLFLNEITDLSGQQETERKRNVAASIQSLRNFQTSGGGMAYWPGASGPHSWASNYALHFLTEARRAGFTVPPDLYNKLVRFQKAAVRQWHPGDRQFYVSETQLDRDQAYRLFGLALAGERDMSAMNRLRQREAELPAAARYQLAAAFALGGAANTATKMLEGPAPRIDDYRETGYTFGSGLRDMAMVLESLVASDRRDQAARQAYRLAETINERSWLNTQEAAFCFVALGKVMDATNTPMAARFAAPGGSYAAVGGNSGIEQIELPTEKGASFRVENTGGSALYATVITAGKPLPGEEKAVSQRIALDVVYADLEGNAISVDRLLSGTDFVATYTVTNPGSRGRALQQIALNTLLPSGWEVSNDRLTDRGGNGDAYNYRDFRDDRVYTFFDIEPGEQRTYSFRMTAAYPGRFYLPSQSVKSMYDLDVQSVEKGRWVEVTTPAR